MSWLDDLKGKHISRLGVGFPDRKGLNFSGNFSIADNPATGATDVDVSFVGGQFYATLTGEAGVTTNVYPPGDFRRYGAVGDGITDDTAAVAAALTASGKFGIFAYCPGGYAGFRVTAGFANATYGQDIKLRGDGSSRVGSFSKVSKIILDSASGTSFFYSGDQAGHLVVRDLDFSCAEYVLDRAFFRFTANVGNFNFNNVNFYNVERPLVFKAASYFQNGSLTDVQFSNSGTIHSESSALVGTLLALNNVNHEGSVPINTPKVVMNLQGVRHIVATNLLLEGAAPAASWTVLNLDLGAVVAGINGAEMGAVINGFWIEFTTFDMTPLSINGMSARFSMASGLIDQNLPVVLNHGALLQVTDSIAVGAFRNFNNQFSFTDVFSKVMLENCKLRDIEQTLVNQIELINCVSAPDDSHQVAYVPHTTMDAETIYEWKGELPQNQTIVTFPTNPSYAYKLSVITDAVYGRLLSVNPNGQVVPQWEIIINCPAEWTNRTLRLQMYAKFPGGVGGSYNQLAFTGVATGNLVSVTPDQFAWYSTAIRVPVGGGAINIFSQSNWTTTANVLIAALRVSLGGAYSRFPSLEKLVTIDSRATAVPTSGVFVVGDRIKNSAPAVGQPKAWSCTVAGGLTQATRGNTTAYAQGAWVLWTSGTTVWECTVAGTTAGAPPSIVGAVVGTTVVDGTVTWTCKALTQATFTSEGNL